VLNLVAPTINQSGTLRAPLGTINLGAPTPAEPSIIAGGGGGESNGIGNWTFNGVTTQNFAVGQSVSLTGTDGTSGTATLTGLVVGYNSGQETMTVAVTSAQGLVPAYQQLDSINWTITLANPRTPTAITLGKGSLTSVSADGLIIPYGYTTNAASISTNTTWSYNPDPSNPVVAQTITAPPAKLITINASKVTVASGATIDESGGGNLYASEFVPGTGGSLNIFAGQNKNIAANANVYAVMPGYTGITPYDPAISTGGPSIGQQVYLSGIPGLPAGTYTLLPSQYAQLPGAFLVTLQTAPAASTVATTRAPIPATTLADGSALTSGYFISSGSGATDEHWSVFKVMSGPVARQYSQIVDRYANTFFPQLAAVNGTAVPRLPQDAGQLSITASSSLTFQGTGAFTPASGGLGGVADISGNQILVVDDEAAVAAIAAGTIPVANYAPGLIGGTTDPDGWAPLVLAATDLNKLGVESLLLGGSRSFQSDGVHITATAAAVVIANDAASPLSLPDIQVIAGPTLSSNPITLNFTPTTIVSAEPGTGQVIIAPGAVIQASGTVAGGGESNIMLAQATPLSSGCLNSLHPGLLSCCGG
jgi:filamentous hemagglutinin